MDLGFAGTLSEPKRDRLPALHERFGGTKFHLSIDHEWLAQNPLTETALQEEVKQWKTLGVSLQVVAK